MKLPFDENISHKLPILLEDIFSGSVHVRNVGLKAAGDPDVWEYAKNNGLIIVSKDSDMHQRSFVFGYPPKIIWVRLGNCSTSEIEELLRSHFANIKTFYEDDYAWVHFKLSQPKSGLWTQTTAQPRSVSTDRNYSDNLKCTLMHHFSSCHKIFPFIKFSPSFPDYHFPSLTTSCPF